jgi:hypothetical protein
MREMIFGEVPEFDEIIDVLSDLELEFSSEDKGYGVASWRFWLW